MLIALRGHWGEPYPWHTRGGIVTEGVLRALNIPFEYARRPKEVARADPRSLDVLAELAVAGRAAPDARPDGRGPVKRAECIGMLYPELDDKPVVTIMGACAQELYDLGHRENFFYLQHAMGLASSIGLGLALHLPREKVVVLDGDGSVLMNLGTLATLARYRPRNLVHVIFDNGSLLSTGGLRLAHRGGRHRPRRDRAGRRHRARGRRRFDHGLRRRRARGVRPRTISA